MYRYWYEFDSDVCAVGDYVADRPITGCVMHWISTVLSNGNMEDLT